MAEGYLIDDKDLDGFINWARDKMTNRKMTNWVDPDQVETAEEVFLELRSQLDEMVKTHIGNNTLPSPGEAGEIFAALKELANEPTEMTWHMWRDDDFELTDPETNAPIGYGDSLLSSRILQASSLVQHTYSEHPKPVKLNLSSLEQDDYKVYIGNATAGELDAICSVPWMNPSYSSSRFANYVYNDRMPDNEWQRVVDVKRLLDIANFANGKQNYLFNPVLLYVQIDDVHTCVKETKKLNGRGTLEIDFSFLQQRKAGLTDYIPKPGAGDTRPIWIIDGQHRVRGFGASQRGSNLQIPFVLMVGRGDKLDHELCARVFTEINTKSVPLNPLHQIFLRYKFGMTGRVSAQDYSLPPAEGPWTGRLNRRAYELALFMACTPDSPLYDMIEFTKPVNRRRAHHIVVSAKNWIPYVRKWFSSGNIYSQMDTDAYNEEELMNFFTAFEHTCSVASWDDQLPRWEPGRAKNKPLLQFEGPFLSLLELYPSVISRITEQQDVPRPIPMDTFVETLAPLTNADWRHASVLRSNLTGRTNHNIKHLVKWMYEAICHGGVYSADEILDASNCSMAGRGLLAPPAKSHIEVVSDVKWPTALPLVLRAARPLHTTGMDWVVRFIRPSGPVEWDFPRRNVSGNELTIEWRDIQGIARGCKSIEVQAVMRNAIGSTLTERRGFTSDD